jgi:hypothetical protein
MEAAAATTPPHLPELRTTPRTGAVIFAGGC